MINMANGKREIEMSEEIGHSRGFDDQVYRENMMLEDAAIADRFLVVSAAVLAVVMVGIGAVGLAILGAI